MKNQVALADSDISWVDKKKRGGGNTRIGVLDVIIPLGKDISEFFPHLPSTLTPQNTH